MGRRYDHSREELRQMMLEAARDIVVADGPRALTARAVAARVGYAVGTLYTQFDGLDDLVFHLNAETLATLAVRLDTDPAAAPEERLRKMARAYLDFISTDQALWQLLFDYVPSSDRPHPEAFAGGIEGLIARVGAVVRDLKPDIETATAEELAFGLFASVHGICLMRVGRDYRAFLRFDAGETVDRVVEAIIAGLLNPLHP